MWPHELYCAWISALLSFWMPLPPFSFVTVSLSGSDGGSGVSELRYWIDGGPVNVVSAASASLDVSAPQTTITLRAVDRAGNVSTPATVTVRIDLAAPNTSLLSAPPEFTSAGSASFTFTSDESGSVYECSPDGGVYTACASPLTLQDLSHGAHSLAVRAVDPAGNRDPSPILASWTVNHLPAAAAQSLPAIQDTPLALTLSGSDLDGDLLAYSVLSQPAHGSLSGTLPHLTYTPAPGYAGADSFTFSVADGYQSSPPAQIVLDVRAVGGFSGYIDLQGRSSDSGALVQVFASGSGGAPLAQAASLSSGKYLAAGAPGAALLVGETYYFYVDRDLYLPTRVEAGERIPHHSLDGCPETVLHALLLLGGDATNDNLIDAGDLACIGAAYGGSANKCTGAGASSDVNGDGVIDLYDLTLLGGNYFLSFSYWAP